MKRNARLWVLLLLGSMTSTSSAIAQDPIARQFIGTWRLVSWTERLADGTLRRNPQTVAYLIYTDAGMMCYVGMNHDRPPWKSTTTPTPQEAQSAAYPDFGAYCGAVELHAAEGFVIHRVEIDQNPGMVGKPRKRWFRFYDTNRLSLRVDALELNPPVVDSVLAWQRLPKY